jgi:hypothetical protein
MPLTYSIAYGLIAGIVSYAIMEGTFLLLSYVGIPKPVWEEEESNLNFGAVISPADAEDETKHLEDVDESDKSSEKVKPDDFVETAKPDEEVDEA